MRVGLARLFDIMMAIEAIDGHLTRGDSRVGLVFDAVRGRLIEIGEDVGRIGAELPVAELRKVRSCKVAPGVAAWAERISSVEGLDVVHPWR